MYIGVHLLCFDQESFDKKFKQTYRQNTLNKFGIHFPILYNLMQLYIVLYKRD